MKLDIWYDKLPEDRAKYYNRTRMSMELFAQKLGIAQQVLLKDFWNDVYCYDPKRRIIEKRDESASPLRNRAMFKGF